MDILAELDKLAREVPATGINQVLITPEAWMEFTKDYQQRTGIHVHPAAGSLKYNGFTVVRTGHVDFEMP